MWKHCFNCSKMDKSFFLSNIIIYLFKFHFEFHSSFIVSSVLQIKQKTLWKKCESTLNTIHYLFNNFAFVKDAIIVAFGENFFANPFVTQSVVRHLGSRKEFVRITILCVEFVLVFVVPNIGTSIRRWPTLRKMTVVGELTSTEHIKFLVLSLCVFYDVKSAVRSFRQMFPKTDDVSTVIVGHSAAVAVVVDVYDV